MHYALCVETPTSSLEHGLLQGVPKEARIRMDKSVSGGEDLDGWEGTLAHGNDLLGQFTT